MYESGCLFVIFIFLQPVLGHGSQDAQPFKQTKDGEIFFTEDAEINLTDLAEEKKLPVNMGQPSVRGNACRFYFTVIFNNGFFELKI